MDEAKIKHILLEYYLGVGKTIFLHSKSRTLFKMRSAYGKAWNDEIAEKVYEELAKDIKEGKL